MLWGHGFPASTLLFNYLLTVVPSFSEAMYTLKIMPFQKSCHWKTCSSRELAACYLFNEIQTERKRYDNCFPENTAICTRIGCIYHLPDDTHSKLHLKYKVQYQLNRLGCALLGYRHYLIKACQNAAVVSPLNSLFTSFKMSTIYIRKRFEYELSAI